VRQDVNLVLANDHSLNFLPLTFSPPSSSDGRSAGVPAVDFQDLGVGVGLEITHLFQHVPSICREK